MAVAKAKSVKVKAKKEKKEGIFSKWRRAKSVGRSSGWDDAKKIPDVKGAAAMAVDGYRKGHKDHKTSKKIEKRYNNKK